MLPEPESLISMSSAFNSAALILPKPESTMLDKDFTVRVYSIEREGSMLILGFMPISRVSLKTSVVMYCMTLSSALIVSDSMSPSMMVRLPILCRSTLSKPLTERSSVTIVPDPLMCSVLMVMVRPLIEQADSASAKTTKTKANFLIIVFLLFGIKNIRKG